MNFISKLFVKDVLATEVNEGNNVPGLNEINNPLLPDTFKSQSGVTFLGNIITSLISLIFIVGAVAFIFMLLIGGVQWILSGGDKQAVESARGRIVGAVIGLVVLFSAYAIINLIQYFFGITILTLDIGKLIIK